jgi:hypothetical protein
MVLPVGMNLRRCLGANLAQTAREADLHGVQSRLLLEVAISFAASVSRPGCTESQTAFRFEPAISATPAATPSGTANGHPPDANRLATIGAEIFLYGALLFFVCVFLRAESGTAGRAVAWATRDALRFILYLIP